MDTGLKTCLILPWEARRKKGSALSGLRALASQPQDESFTSGRREIWKDEDLCMGIFVVGGILGAALGDVWEEDVP